ncbi:Top3a [Symbiodinium pilosum]|uniref:Top3a protein n=1 Tax=Symbiodinium pilosum TaxID=2952 RepID=A0A812WZ32_SYMPI|nr:Top3a [Symbiodinium pilosum]
MSAPLCNCDPPRSAALGVAGRRSKHQGREFWTCQVCDFFQWLDLGGTNLSAAGPPCRCGHPSVLKITQKAPNVGRSFWTCASSGTCRCGFFQWESPDWEPPASASQDSNQEEQNCKKCGKAVRVMTVEEHNQKGNAGRKYYRCRCGNFEFLTTAKPVAPPSMATPGSAEYVVDEITRRHLQRLFDVPFGTKMGIGRDQCDRALRSQQVLSEGGGEQCGPYDYLKVECAWRVSNPQRQKRYEDFLKKLPDMAEVLKPLEASKNEMLLLHGTKPEHLHGILFEGLDGKTCAKTKERIFVDGGNEALRFVIFDPAALSIDFLVALKRVQHYCNCGQAAVRRTVTNGQPENFGREILFCHNGAESGCGFIHMLPQCHCGRAAGVARKKNGERYFRCGSKRDFCDFKELHGFPSWL